MCFVSPPNQRCVILFWLNIHVIFLTSFCKTPLWNCLLYFLGDKNCGVWRSKMTITRVVLSSVLMGANGVVVPASSCFRILFVNVNVSTRLSFWLFLWSFQNFSNAPQPFFKEIKFGYTLIGRVLIAETAIKRASVVKVCPTLDVTVSTTSTCNSW